jgi:ABC-type Fe3+/spermidine/putrescine transport system ATPase subunit
MFVSIRDVRKTFGPTTALNGCSLDLERGEILTLLGPSGCGKTTLLRTIAGFVTPDSGSIVIDSREITRLPAHRRGIGMVFQNYALFPHMTVAQNVSYGLMVRGTDRARMRQLTEAALALVNLTGYGGRWPRELSGGQQQRVALARVLVLEPQVLLLDEPFGALDAKLRLFMQIEVKQIVQRLGITTLLVTHDQDEALTMSDRVAVINAGVIEQVGTPLDLYDRPVSPFVADFVGLSNWFERTAKNGLVHLLPGTAVPSLDDGPLRVMVRPENLALHPAEEPGLAGAIIVVKQLGTTTEYRVRTSEGDLSVVVFRAAGERPLALGTSVSVTVRDASQCRLSPAVPA